jgi:hypothetical protein
MSCLTEKAIRELSGKNFFIPSYQRGYRWTERQIEDLLEDINAFVPKEINKSGKKTWYCLQPIVVKECDEKTKEKNDLQGTWYEVIDGQQRLTAIFLIIHYANIMLWGKEKDQDLSGFQFKYETRSTGKDDQKNGTYEFLKNQKIDESAEEHLNDDKHIDHYHIRTSFIKIHDWGKKFKTKFKKDFNHIAFMSKLLDHSKVIWYEVDAEKDAIEIFTRINMGKIPLTNAELIKALFLNSSNFSGSDREEVRLRQLEIASEWDRMEYSLQNDGLWYFINNLKNELPTRIDHIFTIIYSVAKKECQETKYKQDNKVSEPDAVKKRIEGGYLTYDEKFGTDDYSTFRFFSDKFKLNTKDEFDNNWKDIKIMYQTIEEWFSDRDLHHKIGYLITTGEEIQELLKEAKSKTKHEFGKLLDHKIAGKVKCDSLEDLEYGKDRSLIYRILLLHNIETMLQNKKETSRFPFERFKQEKWDIEHIHAIATEVKVNEKDQIEWLRNNFIKTESHNDKELNTRIENMIAEEKSVNDDEFEKLVGYVLGDEDNSIQNLCLLDRGTNRSYKNDSFKIKRGKIIENEKNGTFIPICTRNIFTKYYSNELKDLELWNEKDRNEYFDNLSELVCKSKMNA